MNTHQKRTLQACRRVQGWLVAHPELGAVQAAPQTRPQLVAGGAGKPAAAAPQAGTISTAAVAQHAATLDAVVEQLTALAGEQEWEDRAAHGSAGEIRRARTELVTRRYRGDTATLAGWRQLKRVTLVGVRGGTAETVVQPAEVVVQPGATPVPAAAPVLYAGEGAVKAAAA